MKVKAVIIDMDGTITNFNLDYMGARRTALKELDKLNLKTREMTEEMSLYLILKKLKDKLDPRIYETLQGRFYKLLEEMELKAAREVTLYPGATDTLSKLREMSLRIGLVTNNGRAGTDLTLKRYQLRRFFDAIVTRDDCEEMKPDAGPIRKVLAEMNAKESETIFVGDGVVDVKAARAAGLPSVAVATGPFPNARLLQAEPDYLLASINDLPMLIEKLD